MSELQEISVVIDSAGNVQIKVGGVKGGKCRDLTEELERALGGCVVDREHTYEHDEQPAESQEQDWLGQT